MHLVSDTTFHATVVGVDRPGVTARMFGALAETTVLDVEQVVVAGQLVLGAVLLAPLGSQDLLAGELRSAVPGFEVSVRHVHAADVAGMLSNCTVTIVGQAITGADVSALASTMAAGGANIIRIDRVADYPVTVLALEVLAPDLGVLRRELVARCHDLDVDVSVQPRGLARRGLHLVVMDVDSTLIQDEVIEVLARFAGKEEQVRAITEAAMRGELDFAESLHARVAALAGLPEEVITRARAEIRLDAGRPHALPDAQGTRLPDRAGQRRLHRGHRPAGRRIWASMRCAPTAWRSSTATSRAGCGGRSSTVPARSRPCASSRHAFGIDTTRTIAIGDGANDLDMLSAAGHGIAFNAKPVVQAAADSAINVPYLDTVLYLMGISREEVEEADAAAGIGPVSPAVS